MNTQRPTLLMPLFQPNLDVVNNGWLGGVIFVQNLARLLSDLRDGERPRVLILTDADPDSAFVKAMYAFPAVEGLFKPSGEPLLVKDDLAAELSEAGEISLPKVTTLFEQTETLFPACQTLFHPYKTLHWIPDLQHKHLPHLFEELELKQRDEVFATMLYRRRFVLVSSHATEEDIRRFYPNPTAKIYVWPFVSGVTAETASGTDPRIAHKLSEKFLFAPNQFWIHKDHYTLFRALKILADKGIDIPVICTGAPGDARKLTHFAELKEFVEKNGLNRLVRYLGIVDLTTLTDLFRYAAAVVQPSLFEGWSTVVEDAKSLGRPIFLTDLAVHEEQAAAPNPFYFFKRAAPEDLARQLEQHWPHLKPGPDPDAETAGALARGARARTAARAFLSIMKDMGAITKMETAA